MAVNNIPFGGEAGSPLDEGNDRKIETLGVLNFGPYIAHFKAHKELINGLLKRGNLKTKGSANKHLAGYMGDQRDYTMEDKKWFVQEFQPYVDEYVEGTCRWVKAQYSEPQWSKSYALMGLWINYMKANDFNTEHIHKGMLTWIIYLKTPNLDEERKKYEGKSFAPGGVLFHYGEHSTPQWAEHTHGYLPEEGYMWLFPAQTRHEVIPFKSPGERISVSGNLYFIHPTKKSTAELPNLQDVPMQESEDIAGLAADAGRPKK